MNSNNISTEERWTVYTLKQLSYIISLKSNMRIRKRLTHLCYSPLSCWVTAFDADIITAAIININILRIKGYWRLTDESHPIMLPKGDDSASMITKIKLITRALSSLSIKIAPRESLLGIMRA